MIGVIEEGSFIFLKKLDIFVYNKCRFRKLEIEVNCIN